VRPATMTTRPLVRVYRGEPEQVARVRRDVAGYLHGMPQADEVVLIASELAANSIIHGGSAMIVIRCEIFVGYIWIESRDAGADWHPRQPDDRPHGTDLIELLAEDWGTDRTGRDRVTWARVAR
jgi:serine/threonine-protein kinase RsbW